MKKVVAKMVIYESDNEVMPGEILTVDDERCAALIKAGAVDPKSVEDVAEKSTISADTKTEDPTVGADGSDGGKANQNGGKNK